MGRVNPIVLVAVVLLCGLLQAGCAFTPEPGNPEPVFAACMADSITRTSARVTAEVVYGGEARFERISFDCFSEGEEGLVEEGTLVFPGANGDSGAGYGTEKWTALFKGLRPGKEYVFRVCGERGGAAVISELVSFTTVSNNRPSVDGLEILSKSPVGFVVGFAITDDGGEPVTEAGCVVCDKDGKERRVSSCEVGTGTGNVKLAVNGLQPGAVYSVSAFAANGMGETRSIPAQITMGSSVVVDEPGILESIMGDEGVRLNPFVVSGPLNGTDIKYVRRIASFERESDLTLDMSGAVITAGGGSYDGSRFTVENEITRGMFSGCIRLTVLRLPSTAVSLESDAFSGTPLKKLSIPASMEKVSPSPGCDTLEEITVDDANGFFSAWEGVLFDKRKEKILWVPAGKSGDFNIPETVTVIGPNTFNGTGITCINFPEGLCSLETCALSGTMLKEVSLPEGVSMLNTALFQNSHRLQTVRLSANVDYVSDYVFDGTGLLHLYVGRERPPYATADAFRNKDHEMGAVCTLHVPKGSKAIYRNHSKWGIFQNITEDFE